MTDDLLSRLVADPDALAVPDEPPPDLVACPLVEHLKREADRHRWIDANRPLRLGKPDRAGRPAARRPRQTALGRMARGDALKFLGQIEPAWDGLEQAGAVSRGRRRDWLGRTQSGAC